MSFLGRSSVAATVATLSLIACLNDTPVAPDDSGVRLVLAALIPEAGQGVMLRVQIRVFYERLGSGAEINLPSSPDEVSVEGGSTTMHPVSVQIAACFADPLRELAQQGLCNLHIQLTLLDSDGGILSQDSQEVTTSAAQGSIEAPPFVLGAQRIVVIDDSNILDNRAMGTAGNIRLAQNLATFTPVGARSGATFVQMDCGRPGQTVTDNSDFCTFDLSTLRNTMIAAGAGVRQTASASGTLTSIAADVKVLMLMTPCQNFTTVEVNAIKQFAAQGGRVIIIGEWTDFYGTCRLVENQLLQNLGATLRSADNNLECDGQIGSIPAAAIRTHQITSGVSSLTALCASELQLGATDQSLILDRTNSRVLAATTAISTTPIAAGADGAPGDVLLSRTAEVSGVAPPVGASRQGPAFRPPPSR